ncbi:MAG: putative aliphatic sulfonates transport permease protein SsuC [Syntrophorhabdaceae bacterium PtaU1.Bin034]|nr:MAG: putative aliphatic sulfonates transport permease protein SsuC [Syntrophorhabdaceae bacterium PtaU1.Bin034]
MKGTRGRKTRHAPQKVIDTAKGLASIFIFLVLWEALPRTGIIDPAFLPPASRVVAAWLDLVGSGELFEHFFVSLQRAATGFVLALLIVIPLGIAIGWYKGFAKFIDPLIQTFRQTSALALFPVFILFLGIGELSKTAMVFWATQWPILLGTIGGVKYVDPLLIKFARSMGVKDVRLFSQVILPAAMPSILTGIRLGASYSILILVAAEMIGAKAGLGFMIINSQYNFEIPKMYAAILTIALFGLSVNYFLVWLERVIMAWKEEVIQL